MQPLVSRSVLVTLCFSLLPCFDAGAGSTRPYYKRRLPQPQKEAEFQSDTFHIDLRNAHTDPYPSDPGNLDAYNRLLDRRTAAAIRDAAGLGDDKKLSEQEIAEHKFMAFTPPRVFPNVEWRGNAPWHVDDVTGAVPAGAEEGKGLYGQRDLLEMKWYGGEANWIHVPRPKGLALMAYADYFPDTRFKGLRAMVSEAILAAAPGWAGTFGPGVDGAMSLDGYEGNYDMTTMHLLPLVYRYYDELTPQAREHLIKELLGRGRVHRPRTPETFTSGGTPDDWIRAGFISPLGNKVVIGETENHLFMILAARYLTNQLLYQRTYDAIYDNRRNGDPPGRPHTADLLLSLMRDVLRDDFSEYNAKNYQEETRWALLNLRSFAYDAEVRLAARMVLDYVSARFAVSSNDLRRMVPFRRRNETGYSNVADGIVIDRLLDIGYGADPLTRYLGIQAGNVRAFERPNPAPVKPGSSDQIRPWNWGVADGGAEVAMEGLSDYRIPPSIHDLFVNDLHRRFFQRVHRTPRPEEATGWRNCDHMEIYAGSPSYLITAGGRPCRYAINPGIGELVVPDKFIEQIGVAVTTSFIPTGRPPGIDPNDARSMIQFSNFSNEAAGTYRSGHVKVGPVKVRAGVPIVIDAVENYGVAPDFLCGHRVYFPAWVGTTAEHGFTFVDKGFHVVGQGALQTRPRPGFYLAIYRNGDFALMEAFDTWLHPEVSFGDFEADVLKRNPEGRLRLASNAENVYTTSNGNRMRFVIWKNGERDGTTAGARVLGVDYGGRDATDSIGNAGNVTDRFLNGTVMNSPAEAVVEISNPFLGTKIRLDLSNKWQPIRTSEDGEVEQAGGKHEVWVDFEWTGPTEGDFYHPFNSLGSAAAAVVDGGVIRIMPGKKKEALSIRTKRVKLVGPIGEVRLGAN